MLHTSSVHVHYLLSGRTRKLSDKNTDEAGAVNFFHVLNYFFFQILTTKITVSINFSHTSLTAFKHTIKCVDFSDFLNFA